MRHTVTERIMAIVLTLILTASLVTCGPTDMEVQAKQADSATYAKSDSLVSEKIKVHLEGDAQAPADSSTGSSEETGKKEESSESTQTAESTDASKSTQTATGTESTENTKETPTEESKEEAPKVERELISISVKKDKQTYFIGQTVSWDDITVTATYSDGSTGEITVAAEGQEDGYTLDGASKVDTRETGSYTIVVTYKEQKAELAITIEKPVLQFIAAEKERTVYSTYENEVSWTDLKVTATYSDGTEKDVTEQSKVGEYDISTTGDKDVTITYTDEAGDTKTAVVKLAVKNVLSKLKASKTVKTYTVNDKLDVSDLTVTAYYNNDTAKRVLKPEEYTTDADGLKLAPSGKKKLTISYSEKDEYSGDILKQETTVTITVNVPEVPIKNGVRTANIKDFGADPSDVLTDKAAIQDALDVEASASVPLIVEIPAGTYYIGGPLYIHSNTTIRMADNAVIIRNSELKPGDGREGVNHNMIKTADSGTTTNRIGGYDNVKNIVLEGGTWDGGAIEKATEGANVINIGHAENVVIRNTTIKNSYGAHLIELAGVKNAQIYGCYLTGFRKKAGSSEAIQLDTCNTGWNSAYLSDSTPCQNIQVHDNKIVDYPGGIGNHQALADHHGKDIVISNNKITNTMGTGDQGIHIYGYDNITVQNNTISGYINGMKATSCVNYTMTNNTLSDCSQYGVVSTSNSTGSITSNTISDIGYGGILVYGSSKLSSVTQNTITNIGTDTSKAQDGISVYGVGTSVANITKNTINTSRRYGVYVHSAAQVTKIYSNVISNIKGAGIYVNQSGTKPKFKSNQLIGVGSNAIKVANTTYVKQSYTFAPKVKSLNLKAGKMVTQASHLKKIQLKFKKKSYSKSTSKKKYTFTFKKYKKSVSSADVLFTDKYKNVVTRIVTIK